MASPTPAPLDLKNVQGDILVGGLPKKTETCLFFQIEKNRVTDFRKALSRLLPLITTSSQVLQDRNKIADQKGKGLVKLSGVNIAFSHAGLALMGITEDIGDSVFNAGMLADAQNLGDNGTESSGKFDPDWEPAFKHGVHGVILITGDCHPTVTETLQHIEKIFHVGAPNALIHEVFRVVGDIRPGSEKGHEHFGFLDGVSQPAVQDVDTKPHKGQETVPQGVILVGREGDAPPAGVSRPPWALDGSFLCFRYLFQLVPEFDAFLKQHPIPGPPPDKGSELLGARLVGRWKSGAPIDKFPLKDNPAAGVDPEQNDDFSYDFKNPDDQQTQDRCPFAAHTRKTSPRADVADPNFRHSRRILRSGIQFGKEVTPEEKAANKTSLPRGLLFICYQSNIANGFQFIQKSWANNLGFPFNKPEQPGIDPIIGQGAVRTMSGTDPKAQTAELDLKQEWVVSKGGEYFFTPSIPALKGKFALDAEKTEL